MRQYETAGLSGLNHAEGFRATRGRDGPVHVCCLQSALPSRADWQHRGAG